MYGSPHATCALPPCFQRARHLLSRRVCECKQHAFHLCCAHNTPELPWSATPACLEKKLVSLAPTDSFVLPQRQRDLLAVLGRVLLRRAVRRRQLSRPLSRRRTPAASPRKPTRCSPQTAAPPARIRVSALQRPAWDRRCALRSTCRARAVEPRGGNRPPSACRPGLRACSLCHGAAQTHDHEKKEEEVHAGAAGVVPSILEMIRRRPVSSTPT